MLKNKILTFLFFTLFLSFCKKADQTTENPLGTEIDTRLVAKLDSNFISLEQALSLATKTTAPGREATRSSLPAGARKMSNIQEVTTTAKRVKNYYIYSEQVQNAALTSATGKQSSAEEPLLYLINYEGGGASVISSDKRFGDVIVTLDNEITLTENMDAPAAFVNYLHHAASSIKKFKENKFLRKSPNVNLSSSHSGRTSQAKTSATFEEECDEEWTFPLPKSWTCYPGYTFYIKNYGPTVETIWGQGAGYNDLVPLACGSGKAPTGCVATAMAQVLSIYKVPTIYNWNWASMNNYSGSPETARLMSDLGNLLGMSYGCNGSGASMEMAKNVFNQLGIQAGYVSNNDNPYGTLEQYGTWIRGRLEPIEPTMYIPGRPSTPIMAGGCKVIGQTGWWIFKTRYYSECHAWLIDGWRILRSTDTTPIPGYAYRYNINIDETFHFNFGWDGYFNGWYKLNFGDGSGVIDPSINYLHAQDIIFDLWYR
ncbi:hypothetical protein ABIE26_002980 [Pedobacter africanus]|uniref:C10 family peptidase n=1 Tax=Pedobacter africanus TaxID=151894 RepID=UPI00339915C1